NSCLQIWHVQWDHLCLSSLSPVPKSINTTKTMASKKIQSVPATRGKSVSASFSSGDSARAVTRSKTKAIFVTRYVTSIPTQAKAKDVNRRSEPVINLAKKTIARADERNSSNEEKSFSCSKNSREHSLSPVSDADSSIEEDCLGVSHPGIGSAVARYCPLWAPLSARTWVTHPGIALAPNSLNFGVPTTPKPVSSQKASC
ncbi:glutamate receptor 2.2, partial [Prunus dulcis]